MSRRNATGANHWHARLRHNNIFCPLYRLFYTFRIKLLLDIIHINNFPGFDKVFDNAEFETREDLDISEADK